MKMTLEDVMKDLKARKMGKYYSCACPACGRANAAYFYDDDIRKWAGDQSHPIPIRCNRQNNCGEVTDMRDLGLSRGKRKIIIPHIKTESAVQMTKEGVAHIDSFAGAYVPGEGIWQSWRWKYPESFRGIPASVLRECGVVFWSIGDGFIETLRAYWKNEYGPKYGAKSFQKRDLLFPVYGEDGKCGRILLRSLHGKPEKKEIQLVVREGYPEIWNLSDLLDPEKKTVFITEGAFDAMSVRTVLGNGAGICSLPGVGKYRQIIRMAAKHPEIREKGLVLAFDTDRAGVENGKKALETFKAAGLSAVRWLPPEKDCNEALLKRPDEFASGAARAVMAAGLALRKNQERRRSARIQTVRQSSGEQRAFRGE